MTKAEVAPLFDERDRAHAEYIRAAAADNLVAKDALTETIVARLLSECLRAHAECKRAAAEDNLVASDATGVTHDAARVEFFRARLAYDRAVAAST